MVVKATQKQGGNDVFTEGAGLREALLMASAIRL